MPRQTPSCKDWCFTINNPRTRDRERCQKLLYNYLVYQLEVGEGGTPHLQGFVQFQSGQRLSACKKMHKRAHWEPRRGTAVQAAHYCKKPVADCACKHCEGVPRVYPQLIFEDGHLSSQGGITSEGIVQVLKAKGLTAAIVAYPKEYMGMHMGMEKLANFYSPVRDWQTVVTVAYGVPGSGKTRYAMQGPSPYKLASFGSKTSTDFFGDYRPDQHETLVVDDFYGNWKYTTFLQACDRYPMEVHTKGGFRQLLVHHIVFTSNNRPGIWYPKVLADVNRRESFNRRLTNIIEFTQRGYIVRKGNLPWNCDFASPLTVQEALMHPEILENPPPTAQMTDAERGYLQYSFLERIIEERNAFRNTHREPTQIGN